MKGIKLTVTAITAVAAALMSTTAFAGTRYGGVSGSWIQDGNGWRWQDEKNTSLKNIWCWIDGNDDGMAECYYFDNNGYLKTDTAEGMYAINSDGQWNVNGIIQTLDLWGIRERARNDMETRTQSQEKGTPNTWAQTAEGHWKYYRYDGSPVTSTWFSISGKTYLFNADGEMFAWREGYNTYTDDNVIYGYYSSAHPEDTHFIADPPTYADFWYTDEDKEMLAMGLDPNSTEDGITYNLPKPFSLYNKQGSDSTYYFYRVKYLVENELRDMGYKTPYYKTATSEGTYSQAGYPVYYDASIGIKTIQINKLNSDGSQVTNQQVVDTILDYYRKHPGDTYGGVHDVKENSDSYTFTIYSKQ